MRKLEEMICPTSCLNKAREDERIFVLLERDKAFAATIRFWAKERVLQGLNQENDPQILEALILAECVERAI